MAGAFGSGGHPSVGRKPKEQVDDTPLPEVAEPEGLTGQALDIWRELAPLAREQRTLSPAMAQRFARLCGYLALERRMLAQIDTDGLTETKVSVQMDASGGGVQVVEKKAHTLLSKVLSLSQRIDVGLVAFRLGPTGRPLAAPVTEKPKNALEQLQARTLRAI